MSGRWLGAAALSGALAMAVTCGGGSSSSTGPSGACTSSSSPNTFVLQNNQVCPTVMTIPRGTQVTMVNNDSVVHEMYSDPHPEHTDCPELNDIGFLSPGQTRQSSNLNIARNCGFHDHLNPDNNRLKGTITIQ